MNIEWIGESMNIVENFKYLGFKEVDNKIHK
jgi:hypothetical protein